MNNDPTRVQLHPPKRPGCAGTVARPLDDDDTVVDSPHPTTSLMALLAQHPARRAGVSRWVRLGADIHACDSQGTTPLMWMAQRGELDTVVYLVGRGARVNAMDRRGFTAFAWAAWQGHVHVMAYLKSRGANPNAVAPVFEATRQGRLTTLTQLFEHGTRLDLRDRDGNTLLMAAATAGHLAVSRYLLSRGIAQEPRNVHGRTALDCSIAAGHFRVAVMLECGTYGVLRYALHYGLYWLRRRHLRLDWPAAPPQH